MQILWENEKEGEKGGRYAYNKDGCYFEIQTNTKNTIIDLTVFPSSKSDECAFGLKGTIPNLKEVKAGSNLSLDANNLVYDLVMFNPGNVEQDDECYIKHYRDAENQELANKTWGDSPNEALSRPVSIRFYKDTTRN
jgi:hypothetical protein